MPESPAIVSFDLPSIPRRPVYGHKGTFGKVVIVGGSVGMSGAVCLSSVAALRTGSGLVTAIVPRSIQPLVAAFEPCVMTIGLRDDVETGLIAPSTSVVTAFLEDKDAVGVGPGLSRSPAAAELLRAILLNAECPVIVDADGLNLAAEHGLFSDRRSCPCVITPHVGEFSRLTARSILDVEAYREEIAREYAATWNLIVVLKGPGTIVTDGNRLYRNTTGNSGMATAGSGDVLTGIITSLAGQKLPAFEAAALGVYAHGLAGDLAANRWTERGMIASDLLPALPEAWKQLELGNGNVC
jgi:ADP-dependent NAD(P)H-hydrate dehydratase